MIENSEFLLNILRLALTTATLTLPAISIAYFIIGSSEEERERMSKVIGYGSLAAIILVFCSLFTFGVLMFGYENEQVSLAISGMSFVIGLLLILYVLFVLAGFKRVLPMPGSKAEEKET